MTKNSICLAALTAAMLLMAGTATAGDCRPVNAHTGTVVYLDPPCYFQGVEYTGFCAEFQILGTLNGTWYAYGPEIFWERVSAPLPPGFSDLYANWHMSRFGTNRGEVWAHGADILNLDGYLTYGTLSSTFWIVGGTAAYEGATGWMGATGNEIEGVILIGEICTP